MACVAFYIFLEQKKNCLPRLLKQLSKLNKKN